jgi:hypothetical protein
MGVDNAMTQHEINVIKGRMQLLASTLIFYGDQKESVKRIAYERNYWQAKIDTVKATLQALILRLQPSYSGTVEEYVVRNRYWLVG